MKNERKKRVVAIFVTVVLCFALLIPFSCQDKHETSPQIDEQENTSEFFVNEDMAKTVAENFIQKTNPSLKSTKNFKLKKIKDEMGEELIYVINFNEGGSILMPTDKRIFPILAFSETENFEIENLENMNGIGLLISLTKKEIKEMKKSTKFQSKELKELWKKYLTLYKLKDEEDPPDDPCVNTSTTVGPLTSTLWSQGANFNLDCPDEAWVENRWNCQTDFTVPCPINGAVLNGHARAGCVAVAMGTIMNYHEYPTNYNWSQMPQDNFPWDWYGNSTVADLLRDIGDAVDMKYKCLISEADNVDAVSAFENEFGYSTSTTLSNYNINTTMSEISNDRPVYFYGEKDGSAHAWVCDGYRTDVICLGDLGYVYNYLSMKFGNFMGTNDKFYYYNNINGYSNLKTITGIKP